MMALGKRTEAVVTQRGSFRMFVCRRHDSLGDWTAEHLTDRFVMMDSANSLG